MNHAFSSSTTLVWNRQWKKWGLVSICSIGETNSFTHIIIDRSFNFHRVDSSSSSSSSIPQKPKRTLNRINWPSEYHASSDFVTLGREGDGNPPVLVDRRSFNYEWRQDEKQSMPGDYMPGLVGKQHSLTGKNDSRSQKPNVYNLQEAHAVNSLWVCL